MISEQGVQQPTEPTVGRARVAIIAVVLVLAAGIGLVLGGLLVTGGGATLGRAASYVPGDTVMYFEARLDLPGEQRANLRAILERFPALDPDEVLGDALADTLDQALLEARAPVDYSSDIAPWFDGSIAVALLDYPLNADPMQMELPSAVVLLGVRDAAAAAATAETLRAELERHGAAFTSSDHDGLTIWSLETDRSSSMPISGIGFAYAVAEDTLVLSNGAAVLATALDTVDGGSSLADNDGVARLLSDLPDERVGTMVVNSEAMLAEMVAELEDVQPGLADALAPYLDAVAPLSVGTVSFAGDAVVMDTAEAATEGSLAPANGDRGLTERVPADALAYADASNLGAALQQGVTTLKAMLAVGPMGAAQIAMLEQAEDALGAELEELVEWIGSGAMAVGWDGDEAYFGLLLEATEPAAAERRLNQLGALAELAAGDPSSGLEVTTEIVDGVEVTTLRVVLSGVDGPMGMAQEVVVEYAVDGDVALIGIGDAFVRSALTLDPSDSLAEADRFRAAVDRFGGDDNAGVFYVDLAALRGSVETVLPADADLFYANEIRPNVEPFDYIAGVTRVEDDRVVTRLGLVLR